MKKRTGKYISMAWFRAYDREMSDFWMDDIEPTKTHIELRILDICHTVVIHEIKIVELKKPI